MAKDDLTAQRLREVLDYNAETGVFFWKVRPASNHANVGEVAGSMVYGYIRIGVDGAEYRAHRLAWLYVYGCWPMHYIDHLNGVRTDNRISNLRDVSNTVNNQNRRAAAVNNRSCGLLGVTKTGKSWQAKLQLNGKAIYIGKFPTADEAHAAYLATKRRLHEGCTI